MSEKIINKSVFFKASRETVWTFLTNKDKLGQWFFTGVSDLQLNQEFTLFSVDVNGERDDKCWGTVLEMVKPSHLSYSFTIAPLNGTMTTVTWQLEEVLGGTKLSLSHSGIDKLGGEAAMGMLMGLESGWDRHFGKLREEISQ